MSQSAVVGWWRSEVRADVRQVVAATGLAIGAQWEHRAAVEVEDEAADLVDGRHPQRGQAGLGPTRFGRVLLEPDDFGRVNRLSPITGTGESSARGRRGWP